MISINHCLPFHSNPGVISGGLKGKIILVACIAYEPNVAEVLEKLYRGFIRKHRAKDLGVDQFLKKMCQRVDTLTSIGKLAALESLEFIENSFSVVPLLKLAKAINRHLFLEIRSYRLR